MAIVLLVSGGVESLVLTYLAKQQSGVPLHSFFVDYGQRTVEQERKAVHRISRAVGAYVEEAEVSIPSFTDGGGLTDSEEVQVGREGAAMLGLPYMDCPGSSILFPYRNVILLSMAASYALRVGATEVWTGFDPRAAASAGDKSEAFISAMGEVFRVATERRKNGTNERGVSLMCPFVRNLKADTVSEGERLKVPWELSWSCYNAFPKPCGVCDACEQRRKAFQAAGSQYADTYVSLDTVREVLL